MTPEAVRIDGNLDNPLKTQDTAEGCDPDANLSLALPLTFDSFLKLGNVFLIISVSEFISTYSYTFVTRQCPNLNFMYQENLWRRQQRECSFVQEGSVKGLRLGVNLN